MKSLTKTSTLALVAAAAIAMSPMASFAMGNEIDQLQTAVEQDLSTYNIDPVNVQHATLAQLTQIKFLLDGHSGSETTDQINHILGNDGPHMDHMSMLTAKMGHTESQLEMAAVNDLTSIGVTVAHPGKLTVAQLAEIKMLFDAGDAKATKEAVEAILAK